MIPDSGLLFLGHPVYWFYPYHSFKQQLMTSQIRSHMEYLMQTYNLFLILN